MTPRHFAMLAAAAGLSLVAALFVYSTSAPWTQAAPDGVALFEELRTSPPEIAQIEVEQASRKLTLVRKGDDWLLKEHDSFPVAHEKVRAFLVNLTEAELVEAKTRKRERWALLSLEGPKAANSNSRLVRLLDDNGTAVAELIVGKKRADAFGSGKGGTYVRKPGDAQTWLVNTEIDAGTSVRDWVRPRLFEARRSDIKHITVQQPGAEDLNIALSEDGNEHLLQDIPEGMKIKFANSIDDIAEAARSYDFDGVRKPGTEPDGEDVSTVKLELGNGLVFTVKIRSEDGVAWLTMEARGTTQEAEKEAEELNARTRGWEFRVPKSKVNDILKTREELLEKIAS